MNKLHLAILSVVCWAASIVLAFYATFEMAALVRDVKAIRAKTNDTSIQGDLADLQAGIYKASRVEGIGTDVIFGIICLYILGNSFKYYTDWSARFYGACAHKAFWGGLGLVLAGAGCCFAGFDQLGGENPQLATAWISSGMTSLAIGSFLIIRRYEEDRVGLLDATIAPGEGASAPSQFYSRA